MERELASGRDRWQYSAMTTSELLLSALALPPSDRVALAAKLLASVAPGEPVSAPDWENGWLAEVEHREALEPDERLNTENELPAVRRRLASLFP